jgi:hypothetical protein
MQFGSQQQQLRAIYLTSNMKLLMEWPKMDVANCSQSRIDRPEESKPPRYMYSLRLAMMAAQEKHPNAMAVPTKAVTRMLVTEKQDVN